MSLWLGHITCTHIHPKSEQDLFNTSSVIRKISSEQRGNVTSRQSIICAKMKLSSHCSHSQTILKDTRVLLVASNDMAQFKYLLM